MSLRGCFSLIIHGTGVHACPSGPHLKNKQKRLRDFMQFHSGLTPDQCRSRSQPLCISYSQSGPLILSLNYSDGTALHLNYWVRRIGTGVCLRTPQRPKPARTPVNYVLHPAQGRHSLSPSNNQAAEMNHTGYANNLFG